MEITKISAAGIRLDQHGRVVLDDDLLDVIDRHEASVALAGGTNNECANGQCLNTGCRSDHQFNTQCTNYDCDGPMNQFCSEVINPYCGTPNNVDGG